MPISRRCLLALPLVLGVTPAVFAQNESIEPGPGEIQIEGKITGGSRKERKMTLGVDKVVSSTKVQTVLPAPRPRDVQLTPQTHLLNMTNASQTLVPEGLMLELRVTVIGKDPGPGKIINARLILVEANTLEQRTLLERGQIAVATQGFTRLGDKSWWSFRCSDQAIANMAAYRGGIQMTVDKAAHQYDVQLQHGDVALNEGDVVQVAFRARADRERSLHVEAQSTGGDYPDIGLTREAALQKAWQPFSYTFTAKKIGKRNQFVFGIGQEPGTVWMEDVKISVVTPGPKKAAETPVAKEGITPFTGVLVSQLDLFSVIGKRYDFAKGGEQPFTLLLSSEEDPAKLLPVTLTIRSDTQTLRMEDGSVTVRVLDLQRAEDKMKIGYLMIGPEGEFVKGEIGDALFPEPLYRMQGPATKTKEGFDLQMVEPYRDRLRVVKNGEGWKISAILATGAVAGFVETDASYNPVRIQCPVGGDTNARIFSATIAAGKIDWKLPLR